MFAEIGAFRSGARARAWPRAGAFGLAAARRDHAPGDEGDRAASLRGSLPHRFACLISAFVRFSFRSPRWRQLALISRYSTKSPARGETTKARCCQWCCVSAVFGAVLAHQRAAVRA